MPNMNLLDELRWRGLIHQCTDEDALGKFLASGPQTAYIGFDPTASSLHVGSMMQLMMLRRFQQAGHRPIALVGGATGMIGDPSGKSEERNLLSPDQLEQNVAGITKDVCLAYVPDAEVGDYAIVHVGFAISRVDEASALETLALFEELGALDELEAPGGQATA